jgi:hypothetical protein
MPCPILVRHGNRYYDTRFYSFKSVYLLVALFDASI